MILMPEELTAENGAKYALAGEFHETFEHDCPECEGCGMGPACSRSQGESKCGHCDGVGAILERIPVEWTTIKEIYKRAVALLGKPESEAIAEAVAAERERCLRPIIEMSQKWDGGISDDLRSAIQTIRSTTK